MGEKSRGNWLIYKCLRADCKNRELLCDECLGFSCYEKIEDSIENSKDE